MALFPGKKDGKRGPGSGASTTGSSSAAAGGAPRQRSSAASPARSATPPARGRKGKKGKAPAKVAGAAGPLHERRRRLVSARETTLRDLGGLMLEMYKRNRFREELLLDKCEEVLAIEVEVAHIDQRLFQLSPPNAAGQRPIGRCECGAPILPGQNFCGVCGRAFATLTQTRSCERCGAGLRPGDGFCASCGTVAPDGAIAIDAGPAGRAMSGSGMTSPDIAAPVGTITMLDDAGVGTSAVLSPDGNVAGTLDTPALDEATTVLSAVATEPAAAAAQGTSAPAPAAPQPAQAPAAAAAPAAPQAPAPAATAAPATPTEPPPLDLPDAGTAVAAPIEVAPIEATTAATAGAQPAGTPATDAVPPQATPARAEPTEAEQRALDKAKAKRIAELKKAKAKAAKERAKARARDAKRGRGGED